jgi:hypothetical protein
VRSAALLNEIGGTGLVARRPATQNIAGKKRVRREGADSDCLFDLTHPLNRSRRRALPSSAYQNKADTRSPDVYGVTVGVSADTLLYGSSTALAYSRTDVRRMGFNFSGPVMSMASP